MLFRGFARCINVGPLNVGREPRSSVRVRTRRHSQRCFELRKDLDRTVTAISTAKAASAPSARCVPQHGAAGVLDKLGGAASCIGAPACRSVQSNERSSVGVRAKRSRSHLRHGVHEPRIAELHACRIGWSARLLSWSVLCTRRTHSPRATPRRSRARSGRRSIRVDSRQHAIRYGD